MIEFTPGAPNVEMSKIEADELLEQISALKEKIKSAEAERDDFIFHYEQKISAAKKLCDDATIPARQEIAALTEALLDYAKVNAPEFLKTKVEEYVDWAEFKKKLTYAGNAVFHSETGEAIDGLSVQTFPDTFTVTTK